MIFFYFFLNIWPFLLWFFKKKIFLLIKIFNIKIIENLLYQNLLKPDGFCIKILRWVNKEFKTMF
jgi:hypothetical protein